jgi:hypothetical protein
VALVCSVNSPAGASSPSRNATTGNTAMVVFTWHAAALGLSPAGTENAYRGTAAPAVETANQPNSRNLTACPVPA